MPSALVHDLIAMPYKESKGEPHDETSPVEFIKECFYSQTTSI